MTTCNTSTGLFVLCTIIFSYATSSAMDARKNIENRIKDLRIHRIKEVNSMQKMTSKNMSNEEFIEKIDFKIRLLDMIDQDIKQLEEKLKEQSKSRL